MTSLASRIYQGINRGSMDSVKKTRSAARPLVPSSSKKIVKGTVSASVRKQATSHMPLREKNFSGALGVKGRCVGLYMLRKTVNLTIRCK